MREIAGMSVLITGGGSGLGAGTAQYFADRGARVTICGRRADKLAAVERPAMTATKELFYRVLDLPFAQALEEGREMNKRMRTFRPR